MSDHQHVWKRRSTEDKADCACGMVLSAESEPSVLAEAQAQFAKRDAEYDEREMSR